MTANTALTITIEQGQFGTHYGYGPHPGWKATLTSGTGEEIEFTANKVETTLKKVEAFLSSMRQEAKKPATRFVASVLR